MPPGIAWKWDVWQKGNRLEKEFAAQQLTAYQFLIAFGGPDATDAGDRINPKASQAWRQLFGAWDPQSLRLTGPLRRWIGEANGVKIEHAVNTEALILVVPKLAATDQADTGNVVPVKVTLQRLDAPAGPAVIVDREIQTAGIMSGGLMTTRMIFWAQLPPGHYRLSAEILADNPPVPEGSNTYLYVRRSPSG